MPGQTVHNPAEQQGNSDEGDKDLRAINQSVVGCILAEDAENYGNEKGKKQPSGKVGERHWVRAMTGDK
jgi:hypothetical protein